MLTTTLYVTLCHAPFLNWLCLLGGYQRRQRRPVTLNEPKLGNFVTFWGKQLRTTQSKTFCGCCRLRDALKYTQPSLSPLAGSRFSHFLWSRVRGKLNCSNEKQLGGKERKDINLFIKDRKQESWTKWGQVCLCCLCSWCLFPAVVSETNAYLLNWLDWV